MWLFFTVLLLETLSGSEVDLFVPSFPEMQQVFHLTPFMIELTLAVNLIAHFGTCLVVGHLGDRYGRRPIILLGLVIFMLSSILCIYAPNFSCLLLGRFFQGVGVSGPAVLAYLLISDAYPIEKQQYLMGIVNGAVTLSIAFAPVLGSYITLYFHWQGNFIALFVFSVICLMATLCAVPSKSKALLKSNASFSLKEYAVVFRSKKAVYSILTFVFFVLSYWIFIAIAPILYMEGMHVSLKHFGFYQGALCAIYSIGSFSTPFFLKKFGQESCFKGSLWVVIFGLLCLLGLVVFKVEDPLLITAVMMLDCVSMVLPITILFPLILEVIPEAKGKISATITGGRLLGMAFFVQLVSYFYDGTFYALGLILIFVTLLGFVCYYKLLQIAPAFLRGCRP